MRTGIQSRLQRWSEAFCAPHLKTKAENVTHNSLRAGYGTETRLAERPVIDLSKDFTQHDLLRIS